MNRRRTRLSYAHGLRPHHLSLSIPGSTRCRWVRHGVGLLDVQKATPIRHRIDRLGLVLSALRYGVASLMVFLWLCVVFL